MPGNDALETFERDAGFVLGALDAYDAAINGSRDIYDVDTEAHRRVHRMIHAFGLQRRQLARLRFALGLADQGKPDRAREVLEQGDAPDMVA